MMASPLGDEEGLKKSEIQHLAANSCLLFGSKEYRLDRRENFLRAARGANGI
jgi:hypothetical protein